MQKFTTQLHLHNIRLVPQCYLLPGYPQQISISINRLKGSYKFPGLREKHKKSFCFPRACSYHCVVVPNVRYYQCIMDCICVSMYLNVCMHFYLCMYFYMCMYSFCVCISICVYMYVYMYFYLCMCLPICGREEEKWKGGL